MKLGLMLLCMAACCAFMSKMVWQLEGFFAALTALLGVLGLTCCFVEDRL